MRTVSLMLTEAGKLPPGFHFRIENPPWMTLSIEELAERGPLGILPRTAAESWAPVPDKLLVVENPGRGVVCQHHLRHESTGRSLQPRVEPWNIQ
jgi:hypothetical protein